jgi:hypothetical protein
VPRFVAAVLECFGRFSEDGLDDDGGGPWASEVTHGAGYARLSFQLVWADHASPTCVALALDHGLNAFDPQEGALYAPNMPVRQGEERGAPAMCSRCGAAILDGVLIEDAEGRYHIHCSDLFRDHAQGPR